jgi:hypothetical protein
MCVKTLANYIQVTDTVMTLALLKKLNLPT